VSATARPCAHAARAKLDRHLGATEDDDPLVDRINQVCGRFLHEDACASQGATRRRLHDRVGPAQSGLEQPPPWARFATPTRDVRVVRASRRVMSPTGSIASSSGDSRAVASAGDLPSLRLSSR